MERRSYARVARVRFRAACCRSRARSSRASRRACSRSRSTAARFAALCRGSGLLSCWRRSAFARAFDIAQLQIGHAAGSWPRAGQSSGRSR